MPGRTLKENRFPLARLCRSLLLYLDPVDKRMKLRSIPDRVTPPLPRHLAGWAESARFNDSRVELFLSESRSPLFRWGL